MLSVLGNTLGLTAVGLLLVVVLGGLLQRTTWLQSVLVIVGAVVLVLLAASYLREARREWSGGAPDGTVTVSTSLRRSFYSGLVVGLTNPKGPVIFGTIVPGFIPAGYSAYPTLLWLALIPLAIGPVVDALWVLRASAARGRVARSPRGLAVIKGVGGVMLLVMAAYMVFVEM